MKSFIHLGILILFLGFKESDGLAEKCFGRGGICGDKCLAIPGSPIYCQCGSQNFHNLEKHYCCSTGPCNITKEHINCPNGIKKDHNEPCNKTCPIAKSTSTVALSTEKCPDKGQCFYDKDKKGFIKVCIQTAKLSGGNFTKYCGTKNPEICKNNVTTKNEFSQCILPGSNSGSQLDFKAIKCLNRGDHGANLFNVKITSQRSQGRIRRNLRQIIPNNDTHVLCDFDTKSQSYELAYKWSELCRTTGQDDFTFEDTKELPCVLKNGETLSLYWTDDDKKSRKPSLFCSDISFWIDKPCYEDHEFFDENGFAKYLETRRCSYYQNNFTSFHDKHSCPHTWEYNSEKQNCFPKLWPLSKKECENATKYFYCNISQRCIPRQWLCDGAIQCPIAKEDEAFEFCKIQQTFPQGATIQCSENLRPKFSIEILATPCDGVPECLNGSDEECGEKLKRIVLYMSGSLLLIIGLIWLGLYLKITEFSRIILNLDNPQLADRWEPRLCRFMKGDDLADFKNNSDQRQFNDLKGGNEGTFSFLTKILESPIMTPFQIVLTQLDVLKDLVLFVKLLQSIGWILVPNQFSSVVIIILLLTILVPQLLATARLTYRSPEIIYDHQNVNWKKILVFIFSLICSPFMSIFLYTKQSYTFLKSKRNPNDPDLIQKWEKMKWEVCQFVKLELGMETVYQVALQIILLLMALTSTETEEGFTEIFKEGPSQEGEEVLTKDAISSIVENIGIKTETYAILLLTLSIVLSFKTCVMSHFKILTAQREWFPSIAKLMALFFSLFCCLIRILAIVVYFAPALGLFNLLHHLQAEQTPWDFHIEKYYVNNGSIQFGNSEEISWKEIDRWEKNKKEPLFEIVNQQGFSVNALSPPSYTLYTLFTLSQFFFGFCFILILHAMFIFFVKWKFSPSFMKLNPFEKVLHSLENMNIPFNCEEWDSGRGDAEAHRSRMMNNSREILAVMLVNFVFNSVLLFPLAILAFTLHQRQTFLYNTVGYFEEERLSYVYTTILLSTTLGFIVLGNALAWMFFNLYNEKFHPFQQILDTSNDIQMKQLSIWNDFTTIKQRYLNLMHGLTRIDQHPRRLHKGLWKKCYDYIRGSIQNIQNNSIRLFEYITETKKKKYTFIAIGFVSVMIILALILSLWLSSDIKAWLGLISVCPKNDWIFLNNKCYKFENKIFNFKDASDFCANHGGKLFEPRNNLTDDQVYKSAKQNMYLNHGAWISVFRNKSITDYKPCRYLNNGTIKNEYIDQSNLVYTDWIQDEPNNLSCQEDCAIMQLNNGKLNDEDCRKKHGYICQSEQKLFQMIQFRHKELVALKNDLFVDMIVDRLFVSWHQVTVNWEVINQTAICQKAIQECNGTISFKSGEPSTKLEIRTINDTDIKESSFQIELILPQYSDADIKLGIIDKTLIRIVSGNGTIQFDRKSYMASENCDFVMISVVRLFGSTGEISVKWKTIGYTEESGSLSFYDGVTQKSIKIDIMDDNEYNPEAKFELELLEAKGGAKLGEVNKAKVIIEDNDGECCTRVEVYYKNKTIAYEKHSSRYGPYTRVIGDDVKSHYHYKSNFNNGHHEIWNCGTGWWIGREENEGRCSGSVNSNFKTDKCVHDVGDWRFSDGGFGHWSIAGEGLAVKCLYEPDQGDCCPQAHSIGNGECNPKNINAQCLFDQGDCCNIDLIGNNECDAVNNFTKCEFDRGDCCDQSLIGNRKCDDFNNFPTCENYDGGDCRLPNISEWPDCPHNPELIGDGKCDAHLKTKAECNHDGGDCCVLSLIGNKKCDFFNNFKSCEDNDGGDCRPLNSTDWPDCPQNPSYVGDGICDYFNYNEECNFDGGDCSQCMTNGGADPNSKCIFPFRFNGESKNNCIFELIEDGAWCPTAVDEKGDRVRGKGKWGICGAGCPIPPDNRT